MKLALRRGPATDATWMDKLASNIIAVRLMTEYTHAGIVIGDTLYHATARRGLHSAAYTPERWELIELGTDGDMEALRLFSKHDGAGYDWFSLLAFALIPARDSRRFYCYEWCHLAMTGKHPTERATPESLLELALKARHG